VSSIERFQSCSPVTAVVAMPYREDYGISGDIAAAAGTRVMHK